MDRPTEEHRDAAPHGRKGPKGVPLRLRRRGSFVLAGLGAYLLFLLLRARPGGSILDALVAWGQWGSGVVGRMASGVPIPLAELLAVLLLVRWIWGWARDGLRARRAQEGTLKPMCAGGLRVVGDLGLLVFFFYALWGFAYAQESLPERVGLDTDPLQTSELRALTHEMIQAANEEYLRIHGVPDAGEPTSAPGGVGTLLPALTVGWQGAARELGISSLQREAFAGPRPMVLGSFVRRLGISGMYVPFTGEALVLPDLPAVALGKALAHEGAHQRGIAFEDDANFAGFVAASYAPEPRVRYSAYVFAQRQLMGALGVVDPEARDVLLRQRLPGVRRDLENLRTYWRVVEGPAMEMGSRVNDAYLRRQGVPEGVASYGASLTTLVRYARARDGTLLPRPEFADGEASGGNAVMSGETDWMGGGEGP